MNLLGRIWRRLPGPFRRRVVRLGQRRFTATAGAIIFDNANRILLLEHAFRPDNGWGIPGGFLENGEQPEEALRRELREEIGVEVEDAQFLFARTLKRPRQVEVYFRVRIAGHPRPTSFEIKRAQWFDLDRLPNEISRDQRRLIRRTLSLNENPGR